MSYSGGGGSGRRGRDGGGVDRDGHDGVKGGRDDETVDVERGVRGQGKKGSRTSVWLLTAGVCRFDNRDVLGEEKKGRRTEARRK